jgi:hypothetical protein
MKTLLGFALAAVVAVASLTGCAADPAFDSGAASPPPRGPGLSSAPGPFTTAPVAQAASVDRVHEARERQARTEERAVTRRPRSNCPSCD